MDGFDLDLVGEVRPVAEDEVPVRAPLIKKVRAKHHALARLLAAGVSTEQAALCAGYVPATAYCLQTDPTFKELVAFYQHDTREVAALVEERMLMLGESARERLVDLLEDSPDEVSPGLALEIFKAAMDRAGYAPVQRTVNKNMNMNIGQMLNEARRRMATPKEIEQNEDTRPLDDGPVREPPPFPRTAYTVLTHGPSPVGRLTEEDDCG